MSCEHVAVWLVQLQFQRTGQGDLGKGRKNTAWPLGQCFEPSCAAPTFINMWETRQDMTSQVRRLLVAAATSRSAPQPGAFVEVQRTYL